MFVCVNTTSGMYKSVQTVNPCNLVCGTHCVYMYLDLMQPVFRPNQWGHKAESHTRLCQCVDMQSVAIILHKCVCVCVYTPRCRDTQGTLFNPDLLPSK